MAPSPVYTASVQVPLLSCNWVGASYNWLLHGDHLTGLYLDFSSQGSASACRALEAEPAVSARSSSGETPMWNAEVRPGVVLMLWWDGREWEP